MIAVDVQDPGITSVEARDQWKQKGSIRKFYNMEKEKNVFLFYDIWLCLGRSFFYLSLVNVLPVTMITIGKSYVTAKSRNPALRKMNNQMYWHKRNLLRLTLDRIKIGIRLRNTVISGFDADMCCIKLISLRIFSWYPRINLPKQMSSGTYDSNIFDCSWSACSRGNHYSPY